MRSVIILISAAASACATAPTPREVSEIGQAIIERCEQERVAGAYASYRETAERCINPAITEYAQSINYPWMDLINLTNQSRLVLTDKVDRGEMTLDEARLAQAEVGVAMTQEEIRRQRAMNESARARAQSYSALAEYLNSLTRNNRSSSERSGVTCFSKGEQVSGMNKICYYDCLGSRAAITQSAVSLCPLTIEQ